MDANEAKIENLETRIAAIEAYLNAAHPAHPLLPLGPVEPAEEAVTPEPMEETVSQGDETPA